MQFLRKGRGERKEKKKAQGTAQYHKLHVLQEKMTAYFLGQGYWERGKIKQFIFRVVLGTHIGGDCFLNW